MKIKFVIIVLLLTGALGSCKKMVEGINDNPNLPTDADAPTMLPGVETADMILQGGDVARTASTWSGYCTGELLQSTQIQQYNVIASNFNASWFLVYGAVLKNARIMRGKALSVNNLRLVGLGQLLEAHAIGTAADLWGDIPFTQAFNTQYPAPVYDAQASAYKSVQTLLDSSITNMSSASFTDFSTQEVFFAGKMPPFIQAAYTLKARNYLHTRNYDLALAAAKNGINAAANSWLAPYPATTKGNTNPWYQYQAIDRAGSLDGKGAYAVGLLNPASASYRGNSKTNETARYNYLYSGAVPALNVAVGAFFYSKTSFPMVSYAENLLILAECDFRLNGFAAGLSRLNDYRAYMTTGGYIGSTFLTATNHNYDAYIAADFNAGGIANKKSLSPDNALLANILEERYLTFVGQIEGFNDIRRTQKESAVTVSVPPNTGSQIPQRFLYPQSEVDGNSSVPKPIPALFTATPVNQ
ncbi:MAG: SusD/RagB family nutrient-binding outer membrane lipoprotein [Bacteroidetes bacterium]|nr:SusD/RagB family nutrient-binding outer membrane lipoprotein [Bacteroidota bacterium]